MKITKVQPLVCNGGVRNWVFVKVETDEGITGYGDASACPGEAIIAEAVRDLADFVVGEDPFNTEMLWSKMYRGSTWYGLGGVVNSAISGIDTALWDIKGKALDTPVYNLLGGRCRDRVELYVHCDALEQGDDLTAVSENTQRIVDEGFRTVKTHLVAEVCKVPRTERMNRGLERRIIKDTAAKVEVIRKTAGEDVEICIDVNGILNVPTAVRLGRALEPYDLLFYEEPVPPENAEAMKRVRDSVKIPICTGERLYSTHSYRRLLELQAVDIVMPDLQKCAGLTEAKRIAALAETYYATVAPHNYNSPLTPIIDAHLCATLSNFLILEFVWPDIEWRDEVMTAPLHVEDGHLVLPEGPGWGVDLVEEEIAKHPYRKTTLLKGVY